MANFVTINWIFEEKGKIGEELEFVFDVVKLVAQQVPIFQGFEQLNVGAIDKAYILDGYSLTDAQRVAVEAQ